MKIYVYAICKNEEKFVRRWMKSMSEADGVFVADTGSSDDSVKILKELGATVSEIKINPWRFDEARNKSLYPTMRTFAFAPTLTNISTTAGERSLRKSGKKA